MRWLFTFVGGSGHFLPLVPIARAAQDRGFEVSFACQSGMLDTVRRLGFDAADSGGRTLLDASERRPLQALDRQQERLVMGVVFAGDIAQERAARLAALMAERRPDVMVRDEVDFGAAVAAEFLGVVHVSVMVLAAGGLIDPVLVGSSLEDLRSRYGHPDGSAMEMLDRYLTLVPMPPVFRDPGYPLSINTTHIRPLVLESLAPPRPPASAATETATAWFADAPGRWKIYFTLGTIFHQESGDLFARVLAALTTLDVAIIVTVGREIDPEELGGQPDTVRVERFLPQEDVLPMSDLVVCQAGSGTVIGALALGKPMVLLPMGADQPQNADRCVELGVARVLDPLSATRQAIGEAALDVLSDPKYRLAAEAIRDDCARLMSAADAVALIQDVVARTTWQ